MPEIIDERDKTEFRVKIEEEMSKSIIFLANAASDPLTDIHRLLRDIHDIEAFAIETLKSINGEKKVPVEPFEGWVFKCEKCYELNIMCTVGIAGVTFVDELCNHCGHSNDVRLPE